MLKYARENGYGVPVVNAVRAVVNADAEAGDADHRLALRVYRDHPDLFKIDRRDGFVWVEPRPAALHLTASDTLRGINTNESTDFRCNYVGRLRREPPEPVGDGRIFDGQDVPR